MLGARQDGGGGKRERAPQHLEGDRLRKEGWNWPWGKVLVTPPKPANPKPKPNLGHVFGRKWKLWEIEGVGKV